MISVSPSRGDRRRQYEALLRDGPPYRAAHVPYLAGLGAIAYEDGEPELAAAALTAAIALDPDCQPAVELLAVVLPELGRHGEAVTLASAALERRPDSRVVADWLAVSLLRTERWADGWGIWPRSLGGAERHLGRHLGELPHWRGEPMGGRTLAVFPHPRCASDADILLFARYAPLISEARLLLVAPPWMHRLLRSSVPNARAVLPSAVLGQADGWALLSDLPTLVGGSGPPPTAPYLRADRRAQEQARLWGPVRVPVRLHVGLAPDADRADDAALPPSVRCGIPDPAIALLAGVAGVRWHRLQPGGDLADLADLAARIGRLDLVVGAANTVTSLAGALGAPCWVLLPTAPDWRWGTGPASPWYPSCRLYRQDRPGDWGPAVASVAAELRGLIPAPRSSARSAQVPASPAP